MNRQQPPRFPNAPRCSDLTAVDLHWPRHSLPRDWLLPIVLLCGDRHTAAVAVLFVVTADSAKQSRTQTVAIGYWIHTAVTAAPHAFIHVPTSNNV